MPDLWIQKEIKMIRKTIGWLMIASVFAGLFMAAGIFKGWTEAFTGFGLAVGVSLMLIAGACLAAGD